MRASVEARPDAAMFGASLADAFRAPAYDCRVVGSDDRPEFAVTRIRSGPRELLSGFCDQAAFTRTFRRVEHTTPSRWRRFNGDGGGAADTTAKISRTE